MRIRTDGHSSSVISQYNIMFTEVRYINNMDPVCCGRTFMTNASDLATLVKCQLGVMEEPKESTDKVSWTVYLTLRGLWVSAFPSKKANMHR